jgi:hypothetical protein
MDFKNIKKKIRDPDVSRLLPKVCDFPIENHNPGYGFKNLWKIYMDFLFVVISISGFL